MFGKRIGKIGYVINFKKYKKEPLAGDLQICCSKLVPNQSQYACAQSQYACAGVPFLLKLQALGL